MNHPFTMCCVIAGVLFAGIAFPQQETHSPDEASSSMVKETPHHYMLHHVSTLRPLNNACAHFADACPVDFGFHSLFLSDWLDEGAHAAVEGLQIQQIYHAEYLRARGDFEFGAGFEYFQIDTTGGTPGSSALERNMTVYLPLAYRRVQLQPLWSYISVPDGDDSGEIGAEIGIDMPLNPTFSWNYDYDDITGNYFEWGLSHDFDIVISQQQLAVLTPCLAMGLDSHKATDHTQLSHIDFGLDLSIPLTQHLTLTGMLHISKALGDAKDTDGERVFKNIVPWGGIGISACF